MKFIYALLLALCLLALVSQSSAGLMGGWSKQDPTNEEYTNLWYNQVQGLFLTSLNDDKTTQINARPMIIGVKTQVVAGLNILYTIKFDNKIYDIKVFRNLNGDVSITSINNPQV